MFRLVGWAGLLMLVGAGVVLAPTDSRWSNEVAFDGVWQIYLLKQIGCVAPTGVGIAWSLDLADCSHPHEVDARAFGRARELAKGVFGLR